MFDTPVDTWYLTVGVALAGVAFFGVATDLPTHAPPDTAAAADTVDAVAASEAPGTAEHPISADRVLIGSDRIALRGDGGTGHATFDHGPVTPVSDGTQLEAVLEGADPSQAFTSQTDFKRAVADARDREPTWESTDGRIVVRNVSWGGPNVTLVGA
jgi:hypothetical protein